MSYDRELADRIREIVAVEPGLSEKAMFGGLAFLVNGNMSVSAGRSGGLMLRADSAQTEALLGDPHAARMVMRGRELAGWLRVDAAGTHSDADLRRWVQVGVGYARSLPPK